MSYDDKAIATGHRPPPTPAVARPAWLTALDGLCQPCADAEFYGTRKRHEDCKRGDCRCSFTIPGVWPAGTWAASA